MQPYDVTFVFITDMIITTLKKDNYENYKKIR